MLSHKDVAQKIEELEKDWSVTGPIRCISFTCSFQNYTSEDEDFDSEKEALELERFAIRNGFKVVRGRGCGEQMVISSKYMQPIQKDILAWCDAFQEKARGAGSSFDGWSYPDREVIDFWPDDPAGYRKAAVSRARVLFGETLLQDPLEKSTNADFHLVPSAFLHKAARCQPRNPQASASAFAQWVYSLYANAFGNEDDRQRGKDIEKDIWELRIKAARSLDNDVLRMRFSIWNLIYNGLHVEKRDEGAYFDIPSLTVNGVPLRASPDLIYKNEKTGEVIIVEIKNSYLDLPRNLWPNVWAQLWCYSKIDVVVRSEKVTAVAEVWADHYPYRRSHTKVVSLRALVRRDPRAPAYDRFFQKLFDIYSGNSK